MTRRDTILAVTEDLVADFLYYGRKEDEDLPSGAIEEAIKKREVTVDDIINKFVYALRNGLDT